MIEIKSERGVVHRLGFCAQSETLGEGVYAYINIEEHCELNVFVLFVYAWHNLCVNLYARGREVTLYLACVLELFVINCLSDSSLVAWRREFDIASRVGSCLEYTDVSVGLLLGQSRGITPSPTPLFRAGGCALI